MSNSTYFLTDHEKHVSDRQTGCSGCARWKAPPGATGKAPPKCQNFMYSTLINSSWISHIAHPLYNHWSYPHTRIQGFAEQKSRDEHYVYCRSNEAVRIEMPNKKPIVEYSNGQYQFKVPFMMYADFESILEPIQGASNNPNVSSTRGVNIHTPSGWCVYSKFAYGKVTNPLTQYRGSDCVGKFCEHIISKAKRLYNSFPERPMEPLTKSQIIEYKRATKGHICFKPFSEKKSKRSLSL